MRIWSLANSGGLTAPDIAQAYDLNPLYNAERSCSIWSATTKLNERHPLSPFCAHDSAKRFKVFEGRKGQPN